MGVELQHCAVYGYRFEGSVPWDKISRERGHDEFDRLYEYSDHDAEPGDFVFYEDPRADRYVIAGIVHFLTDSTRRNGPQTIEPTAMEEPEPAKVQAMEEIIDDLYGEFVTRKTDEPEHIVFTHNW